MVDFRALFLCLTARLRWEYYFLCRERGTGWTGGADMGITYGCAYRARCVCVLLPLECVMLAWTVVSDVDPSATCTYYQSRTGRSLCRLVSGNGVGTFFAKIGGVWILTVAPSDLSAWEILGISSPMNEIVPSSRELRA
jgi:hypothetical protein